MYRWSKAGWIQSVNDISDAQPASSYKSLLYPANLEMMSIDGKLMGLPYYSGYVSFIYNKDHLDKANLTPPTTWAELMDQLRKLKRDGISSNPFTMAWQVTPAALSWALAAIMYSEGEFYFDNNLKPTFQDSSTWTRQLQMLKTMFDEQLVPADALVAAQESVPDFGNGTITYMLIHDYDQQSLNTQAGSFKTAPGKVGNALVPGKTGLTYSWTTMILMGAGLSGKRQTGAWDMMQYFGGKDKDGKFTVNKRWALETGLGNPYQELNQDPDITAAWGKWRDMSVHVKQLEKTRGRPVEKTLWFPEWDQYLMQSVQAYLQGKTSVGQLTKDVLNQYQTLVKKYA
jgi:multiple sugar transport system substrate-binding protein